MSRTSVRAARDLAGFGDGAKRYLANAALGERNPKALALLYDAIADFSDAVASDEQLSAAAKALSAAFETCVRSLFSHGRNEDIAVERLHLFDLIAIAKNLLQEPAD